eukprot:scaffold5_cov331-Pavlova_lutheri.AAC.73
MARTHSTFACSSIAASERRTHRVCMSVPSPESPRYSLSCILNTLGKSHARVWFCTPKRRSEAMATHSFPFMAMREAPLYVSIFARAFRSSRIRQHALFFPFDRMRFFLHLVVDPALATASVRSSSPSCAPTWSPRFPVEARSASFRVSFARSRGASDADRPEGSTWPVL